MDKSAIQKLQAIENFEGLVEYLGDELDWPVADLDFEDLIFQYTPEEIGLDEKSAAVVTDIKRLRPLDDDQPWGIFFLELEPKKLPVVALRRLLNKMTLKQRATSNAATQTAWHADDILFISRFGESQERQLTFAHFAAPENKKDLPVLKVLGWDSGDTALKMDHLAETLREKLVWPEDPIDTEKWREQWRSAFELKHKEVISTSKDMASRLAQLARGIRDSIQAILEVESEKGPLRQTMAAFKAALVDDLDEAGFADTYAQTITYGLLSARIADPTKNTLDDLAAHMRTNPFLKELMESFINLGGRDRSKGGVGLDFDELGVSEVVDVLDTANMEAVLRDFGDLNPQEDPVIHFFEGFLQEYDRSIRKDRGVFYTPRPVVSFIVRSVDELLRTEFSLEDGLADTTTWGEMAGRIDDLEIPEGATPDQAFVQVLDPATGTGTFLVEVIDLIHKTLTAKWQAEGHGKEKLAELWNAYVPEHLLPRLHGYELMMAPYAIAHMKIGLKLYETGYRFESDERARVYLTNALEPAQDFSGTLAFAIPALANEAEAVNVVKRDHRFTVVIGNPPYAGHSVNNHIEWIVEKVHDYKRDYPELQRPGQAKWLQDDYVKFIRFAEHILSESPAGVLGFITNHSYLDNPTFKGMRRHLMQGFERITLLDLHGNTKKGEVTPEGHPDKNVFDIQQGVAILLSRRGVNQQIVDHQDLIGSREAKYDRLSNSSLADLDANLLNPMADLFLFVDQNQALAFEYKAFLAIDECMAESGGPAPGFVTTHDEFAISWSAAESADKVRLLLGTKTEAEARGHFRLCSQNQWDYEKAKADLASDSWRKKIIRVLYRPFDFRWTVFDKNVCVHRRMRVMRHMLTADNVGFILTRQTKDEWGALITRDVCAHKTCGAYDINFLFPWRVLPNASELEFDTQLARSNLSDSVQDVFRDVVLDVGSGRHQSERVFSYFYSIFYSPQYRDRYSDFLKYAFPRIPVPLSASLFQSLSDLGEDLVGLHLLESFKLDRHITSLVGSNDFQVEKVSYCDETVWIDKAKTRGFRGVPEEVWNFKIGGYQVCEKWLKDRQTKGGRNPSPGRVLTDEDIEHYQKIVVALSETIRIMAEIDEVIEAHGGWPGAFVTDDQVQSEVPAPADEAAQQLDMI